MAANSCVPSASRSDPHRSVARRVEVAAPRLARWLDGFADRHGSTTLAVRDGAVLLSGSDGATAVITVPFPPLVADAGTTDLGLLEHVMRPRTVGLLLLRRGGFAVGVARAGQLVASKCGTRYVQSRTAAGGWSQQRFARRRANQATEIVEAAAAQAERLVVAQAAALDAVVTGGDRPLLASLLGLPRLTPLRPLVTSRILDVPDPRQRVLEQAVERAGACVIELPD